VPSVGTNHYLIVAVARSSDAIACLCNAWWSLERVRASHSGVGPMVEQRSSLRWDRALDVVVEVKLVAVREMRELQDVVCVAVCTTQPVDIRGVR
jgi:hypothetical protein